MESAGESWTEERAREQYLVHGLAVDVHHAETGHAVDVGLGADRLDLWPGELLAGVVAERHAGRGVDVVGLGRRDVGLGGCWMT